MSTYEQFLARQEKQLAQKRTDNSEQARLLHQVGVAMSGIKSDPRWKLYADHLMGLKESKQKTLWGYKDELFKNFELTADNKNALLIKIHGVEQYILALTDSIELVSRLIDKGEKAQPMIKEDTNA